jgi:hypothetical protein
VKLKKKSLTEYFQMMKEEYGDITPCTQVFEWHKRFVEGQEEVEDNQHPGHHLTSKTEENVENNK